MPEALEIAAMLSKVLDDVTNIDENCPRYHHVADKVLTGAVFQIFSALTKAGLRPLDGRAIMHRSFTIPVKIGGEGCVIVEHKVFLKAVAGESTFCQRYEVTLDERGPTLVVRLYREV